MIKNKHGILLPDTPVMRELIPRLPNETPFSAKVTYFVLADNDYKCIATDDDALIEITNRKLSKTLKP